MEVHLNSHLPDFCKAALKAWMQQPQRWKLEVFRRWFVIASFAKSFWSSEPSHVDHLLWLSEGVKALRICWQPKARRRVFVVSFCHGTLTVREFCLHTQKLFGTAVCVEFIWIFKPIHRRVWRFRLRCTILNTQSGQGSFGMSAQSTVYFLNQMRFAWQAHPV